MERLLYPEFNGYQNPTSSETVNSRPYSSEPQDRVCIHLSKPQTCSISIAEQNKTGKRINSINYHKFYTTKSHDSFSIAGTSKPNYVKYFIGEPSSPGASSVFNRDLKIRLKKGTRICRKSLRTSDHTFDVIDFSSFLPSREQMPINENNSSDKDKDNLGPSGAKKMKLQENNINFVLQTNVKDTRWTDKMCLHAKGINGIQCSCPLCKSLKITTDDSNGEHQLWKHIVDGLPVEIIPNVLQFMCYDQVSWLADKNVEFARRLAFYKYGISDSHDQRKYPDLAAVLRTLRQKNAQEMRFNGNEDMWICNIVAGTSFRYATEKGTYTWHKVASTMALKFDSARCMCETCLDLFHNLKIAMAKSQIHATAGRRSILFALKGSERTRIDTQMSSAFWRETALPKDSDYAVHMWTNDLDNRWLQDLRTEDGSPWTLKNFKHYETLIFKDPVKFFTVPKVVRLVDLRIVAITSSIDNEVLGYMVRERQYRFRLSRDEPRNVIGLNFIPEDVLKETRLAAQLTMHVFSHDIMYTIHVLERKSEELKRQMNSDRVNREALLQNITKINNTLVKLERLNTPSGIKLTLREYNVISVNKNILHVHEVFHGCFEFCSKYLYEPLDLSSAREHMEQVIDFLTHKDICRYKTCNIGVIEEDKLVGFMSVGRKRSLRTLLVDV